MGSVAFLIALVLRLHAVPARQQRPAQPVTPAQGTITSPFGRDGARWHPGIDIGILRSLSVRAAVAGRVVHVGETRGYEGYGNVVIVRSRGYQELHAHLAAWDVRVWPERRAEAAHCIRRLHRLVHGDAPALRGAEKRRGRGGRCGCSGSSLCTSHLPRAGTLSPDPGG